VFSGLRCVESLGVFRAGFVVFLQAAGSFFWWCFPEENFRSKGVPGVHGGLGFLWQKDVVLGVLLSGMALGWLFSLCVVYRVCVFGGMLAGISRYFLWWRVAIRWDVFLCRAMCVLG